MQLSRQTIDRIDASKVVVPSPAIFDLPERVLQFGTGVLLRGLCDYYIDEANRNGRFNGRIVIVKSTSGGGTDEFEEQDNLYTICVRGMQNGKAVSENIVSSAISRVLPANTHWNKVLELVQRPEMNIIISNTTEVGLQLVRESVFQQPPSSYPAKLLACLLSRYQALGNDEKSKVIVIPTELITENGNKLRSIVDELCTFNELDSEFRNWLRDSVHFCNSLVDRIVTKDPGKEVISALEQEIGYEDRLLTMCEDYHLWAIQGNEFVRSQLTFAGTDEGAFVKPDIELFKSLKLHLLNGTHTLSAPLAYLSGFTTVREAMENSAFRKFVEGLMLEEIAPAIPFPIADEIKEKFGRKVIDRFSNPFLQHHWLNITLQQTTKMRMRNMPVLQQYYSRIKRVPERMAIGFAAYLLFMHVKTVKDGVYYGESNGREYRINDEHASFFHEAWQRSANTKEFVDIVLQNETLWEDLAAFDIFKQRVAENLDRMRQHGLNSVISFQSNEHR